MKKIMALSMAIIMAFTMAGCDFDKPAEIIAAGTAAAGTATESSTTAADTAAEGETSGAASGKRYIINTDITFALFKFENKKGEMVGTDLDILQVIAQDQGFEYEVVPVGSPAAVTALETGGCDDVIAGMSVTNERVQKYGFSEPYYDSGVGMAVLTDSDITPYGQLEDQKVVVKTSIEGYTFVGFIAEQYGSEVTQYESSSDVYQAVLTGEAIVYFEDYPAIGYEISRELGLILPALEEKGSSYDFATLKGVNPKLVEMFNKGPENIKASDRHDEILSTYTVKQGLLEKIIGQCYRTPVPAKCRASTSTPPGYG